MDEHHLRIIRSAKQGDEEAFAHLVQAYKDFVHRTAYAVLRNAGEAEDVFQETFIKVFLSLQTLNDERAFPSWLAKITTRVALDYRALRQRGISADSSAPMLDPELVASPTPGVDLRLTIEELMAELSPEHRATLVLREIHGLDYQEIADVLQIRVGTVRSRLHAARKQLRRSYYDSKNL